MVNAYKSGLVPKANLNEQDYQALETDQAHGLTASVFSDYSGDVGTIYNVPSESKVVGQMSSTSRPRAPAASARTSATRTASASPPRPSTWLPRSPS